MSADIIDFRAWCREHKAPETTAISIPLLLPTWPWGWLQPVLLELSVGTTSSEGAPCGRLASQGNPGTPAAQDIWHSNTVRSHRGTAAAARRLQLVPLPRAAED